MEEAERLFSGMQQPHGPVAPNSITFAIMMGAYLAQDKPHQVRGERDLAMVAVAWGQS